MNKLSLAAQLLACPDCGGELNGALQCPVCARPFTPGEDGIINALPSRLQDGSRSTDQLRAVIDHAGSEAQPENIVLYERAFHDKQAPHYDNFFADPLPLGSYYKRLVRHEIYSYVHRQPFVVDLCCGTGKSSMPLVERGLLVVGMDVSREMLRLYKQKCDAQGYDNLLLIQADASRPPLRKESCGAITMIGGLHHIQERDQSVNDCCRALANHGLLILHEPLKTGKTSRVAALLDNIYALTDPSRVWNALMRRMGRKPRVNSHAAPQPPVEGFSPYERPFTSPHELLTLLPSPMKTVSLRSQGLLSFREFAPYLQSRSGRLLAPLVVRLDDWLTKSGLTKWSGDALFAVFQKTDSRG